MPQWPMGIRYECVGCGLWFDESELLRVTGERGQVLFWCERCTRKRAHRRCRR